MNYRRNLAAMAALVAGVVMVSAQGYYDDDIYYDANKASKKSTKTVSAGGSSSTIAVLPGADTYTVITTSTRDVDEYNRRGSYTARVTTAADTVLEADPYLYTRRMSRFDNTELLEQIDDSTAYAVMMTEPAQDITINVNNYTLYDPWNYSLGSVFYPYGGYWSVYSSPWLSVSLGPWGWGYNWWPYYSWSYYPTWGWGWGWCGPCAGPGHGPGWQPAPQPYNPRHPGAYPRYHGNNTAPGNAGGGRPGTSGVGGRPGSNHGSGTTASANPGRHNNGRFLGNGYRPGSTGAGERPSSMSTSQSRPQTAQGYRGTPGNRPGSATSTSPSTTQTSPSRHNPSTSGHQNSGSRYNGGSSSSSSSGRHSGSGSFGGSRSGNSHTGSYGGGGRSIGGGSSRGGRR